MAKRKYWEPAKWNKKYDALVDLSLAHPDWGNNQLGEALGYSLTWVSKVRNSNVFRGRYEQLRESRLRALIEMTLEATKDAIKFNQNIVNDDKTNLHLRQVSSKNILDLGYAKAVEKKASLSASISANMEVPPIEALQRVEELLEELASKPFKSTRLLQKKEREEEENLKYLR